LGTLTRLALVGVVATIACANANAAPVKVRAVLDSATVEFGDPVTATVTIVLDRSTPAPDVRLQEGLAPLTQLGGTRVTEVTRGDVRTVTYSARASCLDERCISTRGSKRIALQPVVVRVAGEKSTAAWPLLEVRGRVSAADLARPRTPLRSDTTPPPVSYRATPGNLARALEVAAVVLAAAGILLAAWSVAVVRRSRRRVAPLAGLERALALAREAESRPPPDRRRALGLLARLLGARDPRLAGAADDLAWSAPAPSRDELAELVAEVDHEVNGR
jgi:hypothetical protein